MQLTNNITAPEYASYTSQQLQQFLLFENSRILFGTYYPEKKIFIKFKSLAIEMNELTSNLDELFIHLPELKENILSRTILLSGRKFTLIPDEFYVSGIEKNALTLNFKLDEQEVIRKDYIDKINSHLISSIDKNISDSLEMLNYDKIFHSVKAFLSGSFSLSGKFSNHIFIQINTGYITIIVIDSEQKLKLINSFPARSEDDIFYHIMNVSKQCQCNPENDNYYLSGNYNKNSALNKLLYNYIRFPFTLKLPDQIGFHPVFENFYPHLYYNLFAAVLCV